MATSKPASRHLLLGRYIGIFLLFHVAFSQLVLWKEYGPILGSYHGLWICSVSMLLCAGGMLIDSSTCVGASLIAVSTGHFLWMIDTLYMVYTWSPQTIFQIANYNSVHGEPTRETIYTTSHHLWFIPICVWWMRGRGYKLYASHLLFSALWILAVSALTAQIVPLECVEWESPKAGSICVDLNVNMVKQWWGMEDVYLFHALDRNKGTHAVIFYLYANFIHDIIFNGFWWSLLKIAINGLGGEGGAGAGRAVKKRKGNKGKAD